MKHGFALLAVWCLTAAADMGDGGALQKLCNQDRFAKACLTGLLTFRCSQYHSQLYALGACLDGAVDTAKLLDLQPTSRNSNVQSVAFSGELVQLMRAPFTIRYLQATHTAIEEAMQHHAPFDLWNHSLHFLGGDKSKALWFLAVLLQDTSTAVEHVEFLRDRKPSGIAPSSVELLGELMNLLQPEQLEAENFRTWLTLFPAMVPVGSESLFNPTVYHFYTLSYLSLRLKWRNGNKKLAAFLPFWIGVAYKFRGISPAWWPLDPKPFERSKHESKLRDIYAAYLATHWAAGLTAPKIGYEVFAASLAKHPSGFLKRLYLNP